MAGGVGCFKYNKKREAFKAASTFFCRGEPVHVSEQLPKAAPVWQRAAACARERPIKIQRCFKPPIYAQNSLLKKQEEEKKTTTPTALKSSFQIRIVCFSQKKQELFSCIPMEHPNPAASLSCCQVAWSAGNWVGGWQGRGWSHLTGCLQGRRGLKVMWLQEKECTDVRIPYLMYAAEINLD